MHRISSAFQDFPDANSVFIWVKYHLANFDTKMHEQSQHYLNKKVAAALSNQVEKPHQETSMIASMKIIHV